LAWGGGEGGLFLSSFFEGKGKKERNSTGTTCFGNQGFLLAVGRKGGGFLGKKKGGKGERLTNV